MSYHINKSPCPLNLTFSLAVILLKDSFKKKKINKRFSVADIAFVSLMWPASINYLQVIL